MARDESAMGIDESDRRMTEFAGRLAHELRTPLGAILMWAHVLRMARDTDRDAALDAIEASARSQSKIIGELLDVSRALTGRLRIERVTVDLRRVVEAAAGAMGQVATARGVKLDASVDGGEFQVTGDSVRLGELVTHLISNGIKFTPSGGSVEVRLIRSGGTALIVVRDSGRGIAARDIPGIFTAFRSTGDDEIPPSGGLGLGLAFVRLLAELHDGVVSAKSNGPGCGAIFTVSIPLQETAAIAPPPGG